MLYMPKFETLDLTNGCENYLTMPALQSLIVLFKLLVEIHKQLYEIVHKNFWELRMAQKRWTI